MPLTDYIEALPEDKRESYKAELARYTLIDSREAAAKVLSENQYLRAENQAAQDRRYAEMEKKYQDEKVPKLLEEARRKAEKSPIEQELEALKSQIEASKREAALEKQKARALLKAQESGIPAQLVDRFIGLTDEETDTGLKTLAETLLPWKKSAIDAELSKLGAQPTPQGGRPVGTDVSKMTLSERMAYAQTSPEAKAQVIAMAKQK